jgi:peptide/nickel transport system permease protein
VGAFLVRRVLSGVLLVAMLTFLTFVVFNEIPTNPACLVVACGPHTTTTDAQIREADHTLGIDRSVFVQYADFEWNLVRHGDLGKAWTKEERVGSLIGAALPATASLVVGGMVLMMLLALPLGCISALRPRSPADRGLLAASVIGLAIHPFVLGITIRDLVSSRLHFFSAGYCPLTGKGPPTPVFSGGGSATISSGCGGPVDWAKHLLIPWLVFALFFLPLYMRMLRVRLLETFGEPWISTARAKGASERRIVLGHALRNAIGPVLPMIAIDAGTAITAAIYVETVFGLGGLGTLAVGAFSGQAGGYDLPLTAGIVTTVGVFVVLLNIGADVAGAWVDPRTRERATKGLIPLPAAVVARPRVQRGLSLGLAVVLLAVVALAIGFGGKRKGNGVELGAIRTLRVNWSDVNVLTSKSGTPTKSAVVTHVNKIELGVYGWRVHASITNRSGARMPVQDLQAPRFFPGTPGPQPYPRQPTSLLVRGPDQFGGTVLKVYEPKQFVPVMPSVLRPHQTWRGTFAGNGKVPSGALIYAGFGQFTWNGQLISFSTAKSAKAP